VYLHRYTITESESAKPIRKPRKKLAKDNMDLAEPETPTQVVPETSENNESAGSAKPAKRRGIKLKKDI